MFFKDRSNELAAGIGKPNPDLFISLDPDLEYKERKIEATSDEMRQFLSPHAVR